MKEQKDEDFGLNGKCVLLVIPFLTKESADLEETRCYGRYFLKVSKEVYLDILSKGEKA